MSILIIAMISSLSQAQESVCGVFHKDTLEGTQLSMDRFGNTFIFDELALAGQLGGNCNLVLFQLNYIGTFTAAQQGSICGAFAYLEGLIDIPANAVPIPINIFWNNFPAGVLGTGTPYWEVNGCGISNSLVIKALYGQAPQAGTACGDLRLNQNVNNFYAGPLPVPMGSFDLFSVALHEGLHILGFASLIGEFGNSINNNFYSTWDSNLALDGTPLIVPDQTMPACCNAHEFNTAQFPAMPNDLWGDCSTNLEFVGVGEVNNLGVPSPADDNDMGNKLSHVDNACNGLVNVMHPGFALGEDRRTLSAPELGMLEGLGVPLLAATHSLAVLNTTKWPIGIYCLRVWGNGQAIGSA